MNHRPTPPFVAILLLLLGAGLCIWMMLGLLNTLQAHALDRQTEQLLSPTPLHLGRDIRHCFAEEEENRDLWDCIRYVD